MNPIARAGLAAIAIVFAGCTPNKEDPPPKPKVTSDAAPKATTSEATSSVPTTAATVAPAAATMTAALSLPKLGAAPAWTLQDVDGKTVTSDQFKGKVVVVDFWATWCGPCRIEIPGYKEMQAKYGKDGLVIVGVSLDQAGPDVVKAFAQKNAVNYPLVMADEKVVAAFGGVEAVPTTFLIDRNGQVRDRKVGAEESSEYEKKVTAVLKEAAGG